MYRLILSVLNPIFFLLAVIFQPILIYTIIRHSPPNLKALKVVLLNTSFFQILHSTSGFLTQFRQVSNLSPIQIWSYGPCRHLEAFICYILYHILQTSAMISGLSAFLTIYMKYDAAKYVVPSNKRVLRVFAVLCFFVAVSVGCEISLVIMQALPSEIREEYRQINQNISDYAVIGYVDLNFLPSKINYYIITGQVLLLPGLTIFLRRSINAQVAPKNEDRISAAKRAQNRLFMNGLTIQVFLPVAALVPVFVGQIVVSLTKSEFLFQQYFIFVLPVISTVCDPFITLYFVKPYRQQVRIWLKLDSKKQSNAPPPSPSVFLVT